MAFLLQNRNDYFCLSLQVLMPNILYNPHRPTKLVRANSTAGINNHQVVNTMAGWLTQLLQHNE